MSVVAYTDGGSRNNPGEAGIGGVIYNNNEKIAEISEFLGTQTNNWAEYEGIIRALEKMQELGLSAEPTEIRMDSKLVVEQLNKNWKIKEPSLKVQAERAWNLMNAFSALTITYVPREQNKEADALANQAMDNGQQ